MKKSLQQYILKKWTRSLERVAVIFSSDEFMKRKKLINTNCDGLT